VLSEIGFECKMISARVINDDIPGPEFDHLSIIVKLKESWLLDVGFGDLFIEPIRLVPDIIQEDQFSDYRIEQIDTDNFILFAKRKNKTLFEKKYCFSLFPRSIEEFAEQNEFKQTSPDSHFVKNTICTLATPTGRKTILNDNFKVRNGDYLQEQKIEDRNALIELLNETFNIQITDT